MRLPFFWVDAFTPRVFAGNPAGVVPLATWPDDALMQRIAAQNGLAETAFAGPPSPAEASAGADLRLRWFTPATEVDLCGHATLATAWVWFHEQPENQRPATDRLVFASRSGLLPVTRRGDARLVLDFPATPPAPSAETETHARLRDALGATPAWVGRTRFDWFVVLETAAAVRALTPDLVRVAALGARGVIVTAAAGGEPGGADFVSRFFAPQSGVPEDPVTGSAHCALAPYWAERLGRTRLQAHQVSPRGGEVECTLAGDRVLLAGEAAVYLRGEIAV